MSDKQNTPLYVPYFYISTSSCPSVSPHPALSIHDLFKFGFHYRLQCVALTVTARLTALWGLSLWPRQFQSSRIITETAVHIPLGGGGNMGGLPVSAEKWDARRRAWARRGRRERLQHAWWWRREESFMFGSPTADAETEVYGNRASEMVIKVYQTPTRFQDLSFVQAGALTYMHLPVFLMALTIT